MQKHRTAVSCRPAETGPSGCERATAFACWREVYSSAMGNFLDTPITDKETEVGSDPEKGMSYGCAAARHPQLRQSMRAHAPLPGARSLSAMQGWRSHMEDDHVQMLKLSQELQHLSLFGVFDGHGGEMARQRLAKGGLGQGSRGAGPAPTPAWRALLLVALASRRRPGSVQSAGLGNALFSYLSCPPKPRSHTTWRNTFRITCFGRRY